MVLRSQSVGEQDVADQRGALCCREDGPRGRPRGPSSCLEGLCGRRSAATVRRDAKMVLGGLMDAARALITLQMLFLVLDLIKAILGVLSAPQSLTYSSRVS